ncbi:MAG: polysaccharide pyruvyl transferase WcaK-like protein [Alphaproteobacteria bacterium]|jgi:polysaccharide pyruvyl transferase WcaK-like protein
MPQLPNAFFSIKTQFENVGDALINREMINLAAREAVVHIDISRCPPEFIHTLGISDLAETDKKIISYQKSLSLFLKMIRLRLSGQACYYFLSPGGYLGDISGLGFVSKYINAFILLCFTLIGVHICHVGVSYERLGKNFSKLLALRSKLLHRHYIRDNTSMEYATSLGIHHNGQMPDLAFHLFDQKNEPKENLKSICFSFRADQYPEQKQETRDFVQEVIANAPADTHYYLIAQVKRDVPIMKILQEDITKITGNAPKLHIGYDNITSCLNFYDATDLIISNRLHVLLMGGSRAGHILACVNETYNMKIKGIMETIGLGDNIIYLSKNRDAQAWQSFFQYAKTQLDGTLLYKALCQRFSELFKPHH